MTFFNSVCKDREIIDGVTAGSVCGANLSLQAVGNDEGHDI